MNLFVAGLEPITNRRMAINARANNYLLSYYHLIHKSNGGQEFKKFIYEYRQLKTIPTTQFIIDSGLFTMMFGAGKGVKYSKSDLISYTHKYIKYMKSMGYEDTIVEMDVHKILGMQDLQEFREIFINEYSIDKTLFVWHIEEKIEGWELMASKYSYIALSIPELRIVLKSKYLKSFIQKMINKALKINPKIKIHLLGCTSYTLLQCTGYYSADSTSWQQTLRYGSVKNPMTGQQVHQSVLNKTKLLAEFKEKEQESIQKLKLEPTNYLSNEYYQISGFLAVRLFLNMANSINKEQGLSHVNIMEVN